VIALESDRIVTARKNVLISVQVTYKPVFRVVKSRMLVGWVGNVQLGREEMKHNFYLGRGFCVRGKSVNCKVVKMEG
jgi:hypothetical protein